MTSLLLSSPPISISHRFFRCRYANLQALLPFPASPPDHPGEHVFMSVKVKSSVITINETCANSRQWWRHLLFPREWRLRKECRNSMNSLLMTCYYPDLFSTSDWQSRGGNLLQPIRATNSSDLGSDMSSVWDICACSSKVIWRGNRWWHREMWTVNRSLRVDSIAESRPWCCVQYLLVFIYWF